jgi:hypothetical protein
MDGSEELETQSVFILCCLDARLRDVDVSCSPGKELKDWDGREICA